MFPSVCVVSKTRKTLARHIAMMELSMFKEKERDSCQIVDTCEKIKKKNDDDDDDKWCTEGKKK